MINIVDLYLKKRIPEVSQLNLHIEEGEAYVLLSSGDTAVNHLINIFSGMERGFRGTVEIDGINIRDGWNGCRKNIVYVSSGSQWPPDMKIANMISFFKKRMDICEDEFEELYIKLNMENICQKRISDIEEVERRKILFALAKLKESKNYIFRDFVKGMPLEFNLEFKKSIQFLKKNGCSILYISDDVFFAPEIGDRIGFVKKGKLLLELKASKMKKMSLKELYFQFLLES